MGGEIKDGEMQRAIIDTETSDGGYSCSSGRLGKELGSAANRAAGSLQEEKDWWDREDVAAGNLQEGAADVLVGCNLQDEGTPWWDMIPKHTPTLDLSAVTAQEGGRVRTGGLDVCVSVCKPVSFCLSLCVCFSENVCDCVFVFHVVSDCIDS